MIMKTDIFELLLYPNPPKPNVHRDEVAIEGDDDWGEMQADYWIDLRKSEQQYNYT